MTAQISAPTPTPTIRTEAPDPIRDGARLAALRDLDLIDSGPDETIDRFTRLAGELLQVPVSLVSLLDADHQFVISKQGLASDWSLDRQTPVSHTLCQFAVIEKAPLVIDDTRLHPLLGDTSAVTESRVIAYASVPLILADGSAVGTLCAIPSARSTRSHAPGPPTNCGSSKTSRRRSSRSSTCVPGSPGAGSTTASPGCRTVTSWSPTPRSCSTVR